MLEKKRIQDQKIYDTIERLEKSDDTLTMNKIYAQTLEILVDTRALLRRVYKEVKPKRAKNIVTDPLKAKKGDIVVGKDNDR